MLSETNGQLARFLIIGVLNTGIGFATILFLTVVVTPPYWISNAGGYAVGLAFSYLANRIWTFQASYEKQQVLRFFLSFAVSYLLQLILLFVLMERGRMNVLQAQLLSIISYTILSFSLQKGYVFNTRKGILR